MSSCNSCIKRWLSSHKDIQRCHYITTRVWLHVSRSLQFFCRNLTSNAARTKLALSHALAQSVKISVVCSFVSHLVTVISPAFSLKCSSSRISIIQKTFPKSSVKQAKSECLTKVDSFPECAVGYSSCTLAEIMQQIGELFLLRMNINLVGSVLDVPVSLTLF